MVQCFDDLVAVAGSTFFMKLLKQCEEVFVNFTNKISYLHFRTVKRGGSHDNGFQFYECLSLTLVRFLLKYMNKNNNKEKQCDDSDNELKLNECLNLSFLLFEF